MFNEVNFVCVVSMSGTCCTCGVSIDYGKMYCESCRPK